MATDYRELSLMERLFGKPLTRFGWWSLGLAGAFVLLLCLAGMWGSRTRYHPKGFFGDSVGSVLLIATAASGIASGVTSGIGIFCRHERSLLLFGTLLFGALVLLFLCGEMTEGTR